MKHMSSNTTADYRNAFQVMVLVLPNYYTLATFDTDDFSFGDLPSRL